MAQDGSAVSTTWKAPTSPEVQFRRRSETPELGDDFSGSGPSNWGSSGDHVGGRMPPSVPDANRDDGARPGKPLEVPGESGGGTGGSFDATKMFIGGLSRSTNDQSLRRYFERFGPVVNASVKMDSDTGHSRGFGFVVFQDPSSLDKVLEVPSHMLDNKLVDPKPAVPLGKRPPPAASSSPTRSQQQHRHAVVANRIFVGGLGDATEEQLQEYFGKFGRISDIDFIHDKRTGTRKGFCFVAFEMPETAQVVTKKSFHQIGAATVEVKPATTKEAARARWMERNAGTPYGSSGGNSGPGSGWGFGNYPAYGGGGPRGYSYPSQSYNYYASSGYYGPYGYGAYGSYSPYPYPQASYPYGMNYGQQESNYGPMKGNQGQGQGQTQPQGQGQYQMYSQGSAGGGSHQS